MLTLLLAGLVGGVITSLSPCVLPVLPIVLTAGVSDRALPAGERPARRSLRPVWVVAGLVASFCVSTLAGSALLSALGLPQDLLRDAGIAVLAVIGVSLLVPRVAELIERPFQRVTLRRTGSSHGNGLVLGFGLGLLYVPCAGPILATIAVLGATHHVGWRAVALTAAFGIGAGVPLLAFALAGDAVTQRVAAVRRRARTLQLASGVVILALAVAIGFNLTDGLQRLVPGYTTSVQNTVEGSSRVSQQLQDLTSDGGAPGFAPSTGAGSSGTGSPGTAKTVVPDASVAPKEPTDLGGKCTEGGPQLEDCGKAPELTGIDSWLNTPGDAPLTLAGLRGKVVLLDFWTYSCINCQRTLPHVEAWYRDYAAAGFEVIGVHTPEFAFEHVRSNVASQATALGVKYPIAIDNEYKTWNAYSNQYWPAEYLIDAFGNVRHVSFGEGDYGATELQIRQLLHEADPAAVLGHSTDVPTAVVAAEQTPETYLGSHYGQLHTTSGVQVAPGSTQSYAYPATLDPDGFALAGTWTERPEYLLAGRSARLELSYQARKAYLVLAGTGSVSVRVNGRLVRTIAVTGVPKLYTLAEYPTATRRTLTLGVGAGVQAYDFTFG